MRFVGAWNPLQPLLLLQHTTCCAVDSILQAWGMITEAGLNEMLELLSCKNFFFRKIKPTLGTQNHEKWRFYTLNIWVIAPKNEGFGFPWNLFSPYSVSVPSFS